MKNCCTDSGPAPRQVSTDEAGRTLAAKTAGADEARIAQLGGLRTLRQTKGTMLAREQTRLSARLGAQHPRVLALSQKMAVNQTLAVQLQRTQARAQASVLQVDPNTWIVHGHVRSADLKPVPQATVALYTCEGQWLRQFGYSCTNADGYFKLSTKAGAASGGIDTVGPGVATTAQPGAEVKSVRPASDVTAAPPEQPGAAPAQDAASISTGTTATRQVCLNVTDARQQFLGGDTAPLTPRGGAVDYREIILDGEVCTPPPEGGSAPGPQGDPGTIAKTQFLGNSGNREVHDLKNAKKGCGIDRISPDHRVFFRTAEDAIKAGYDCCAYCFGKAKSKR
jgi:hypothetical protein